jgi:hypothetical protein
MQSLRDWCALGLSPQPACPTNFATCGLPRETNFSVLPVLHCVAAFGASRPAPRRPVQAEAAMCTEPLGVSACRASNADACAPSALSAPLDVQRSVDPPNGSSGTNGFRSDFDHRQWPAAVIKLVDAHSYKLQRHRGPVAHDCGSSSDRCKKPLCSESRPYPTASERRRPSAFLSFNAQTDPELVIMLDTIGLIGKHLSAFSMTKIIVSFCNLAM